MAATAYAALVSLMNVLTRFQHPTCPVPFDKSQTQTLLENVMSLVEFLEDYDSQTTRTRSIQSLETKMTNAAYAAEDMFESSYVNRVLKRDEQELCSDIQKSIQEMEQLIHETMDVKVKRHKKGQQEQHGSKLQHPSVSHPTDVNIMLGFEEHFNCLMNRIRSHNAGREIIPIVGMGGIGKTTLARNFYDNPNVGRLFDIRAWVTISQNYVVDEIIHRLLDAIIVAGNVQMDDGQPGDQLYKSLCGRKYLIVLDDVWSIQSWSDIRRFFPDNGNHSRILLTTRLWGVANSVGCSIPYQLQFLDDDKSFDLLSKTIYGGKVFPPDLKIFGKSIARSCKGLPLAIIVIGGLLKVSLETPIYWANVAKNVSSFISTQNEGHCMELLSLSYSHMPIHLKSCFLYMAVFEEDDIIRVPDLIKLWISNGLLKCVNDRIFEEVALECLYDLIGRNLVRVETRSLTGEIATCNVHDLLREFCLKKAQTEKFLCLIEEHTNNFTQRPESKRHIAYNISNYKSYPLLPSTPHVRSLYVGYSWNSTELSSGCRLLRVLHRSHYGALKLPVDFVQLVNIRHLALKVDSPVLTWLLPSLTLFWNLETLILKAGSGNVTDIFILPSNIWELPNLRHLKFEWKVTFPDPTDAQSSCILHNLQTFSTSADFYCTDQVLHLIPNLKELSIRYDPDNVAEDSKLSRSFTNLACLEKLEILSISFNVWKPQICAFNRLESLRFSSNIIVLELYSTGIPWESMAIVGSLPNLEVLKLESNAFCGEEWNSTEGEFKRLKHLSLIFCDLQIWRAEGSHFPSLEHLFFHYSDLKEIPLEIVDLSSLESVEMNTSEMSAIISAREIQEERKKQGDEDLVISGGYQGKSIEEKLELEKWVEVLTVSGTTRWKWKM